MITKGRNPVCKSGRGIRDSDNMRCFVAKGVCVSAGDLGSLSAVGGSAMICLRGICVFETFPSSKLCTYKLLLELASPR